MAPRRAPATPPQGVRAQRAASPASARAKTRPGGPSGPGRTTPVPKPRIEAASPRGSWFGALSWKTAVLAAVVILALAVVLPSLRVYFRQQEDLRQLRAERDAAQVEVDELSADVKRWDDPAYIVAQARERLAYVFPGETPYRVVDPEVVAGTDEPGAAAVDEPVLTPVDPWYDTLWSSIEDAGAEPSDGQGP